MSSYQKAILKDAERLGFAFDGFDGDGHIRLRHQQAGIRYSLAATPGDVRSYRNALSAMERLSGRRLPRPNNGHYRHRRQPRLSTELSPTEAEKSREVDDLVAEADALRRRFAELMAAPSRAAAVEARSVLARHEHLRRLLAQCHRIVDPLA
jgi:hypothetical protein